MANSWEDVKSKKGKVGAVNSLIGPKLSNPSMFICAITFKDAHIWR